MPDSVTCAWLTICFTEWHEDRHTVLARRMSEVERAAAAGELIDVTIVRGQLLISPIRRSQSEDAEARRSGSTRDSRSCHGIRA